MSSSLKMHLQETCHLYSKFHWYSRSCNIAQVIYSYPVFWLSWKQYMVNSVVSNIHSYVQNILGMFLQSRSKNASFEDQNWSKSFISAMDVQNAVMQHFKSVVTKNYRHMFFSISNHVHHIFICFLNIVVIALQESQLIVSFEMLVDDLSVLQKSLISRQRRSQNKLQLNQSLTIKYYWR